MTMWKKINLDPCSTSDTQINSGQNIDLNEKGKTIKHLQNSILEYPHNVG